MHSFKNRLVAASLSMAAVLCASPHAMAAVSVSAMPAISAATITTVLATNAAATAATATTVANNAAASTAAAPAAPVTASAGVKVYPQQTPKPMVVEALNVEPTGKADKKVAAALEAKLLNQLVYTVHYRSQGKDYTNEITTILMSAASTESGRQTMSPKCDLTGLFSTAKVGKNYTSGMSVQLLPTDYTEEGVNTLVVITNQTEDISGVVELAKGCPVYEGKGTSSTITRLLNLTFGKATSLILDDGTIVEVTVRHEKVKTPEMLRT